MKSLPNSFPPSGLSKPAHRLPAIPAIPEATGIRHLTTALMAAAIFGVSARSQADTIFSENMGTPGGDTNIATYATGTAPATFQNKATLTYGIGDQLNTTEVRTTSASSGYAGASGNGNVFFPGTSGNYGFSIESIDASAFNSLQLSYAYRKGSTSNLPTVSVDYWNGASWVTIENTPSALFNEAANAGAVWYLAKTLSLPVGAQINGLKIRFVNSGTESFRIDDVKLTGTPIGGDVTPPMVSTLSPVNGADDALTGDPLEATFNEAIQAGTGTISLIKTLGEVPVDVEIEFDEFTLVIIPELPLESGTEYSVVVPAGAVEDLAGNPFGGIPATTAWTFTTLEEDSTPPIFTTLTPANGSSGINPPTSLKIAFDEEIQIPPFPGDNNIFVKKAGGLIVAEYISFIGNPNLSVSGSELTLKIPAGTPLEYGMSYYVEIGNDAISDTSGNAFGGITGNSIWAFTAGDPPALTAGPGYSQNFSTFTSATGLTDARPLFPLGWSATGSDLSYDGDFGSGAVGGFRGNDNVLGYQHTVGTGTLVTTLTMTNGTGGTLTQLFVSYFGRVARTDEGRSPAFTVSLNGVEVPLLAYSTAGNVDVTVFTTITGLGIAPGAEFTLSWESDRGAGVDVAKQIGLGQVLVATSAPTSTYADWALTNAPGQTPGQDFDLDGIDNGTEYFMGTAGNAFTMNPGVVSGEVTWPRASGTTISGFLVETSTNLSLWTDANTTYPGSVDTTNPNEVVFTVPSGPTQVFVRLSVTP